MNDDKFVTLFGSPSAPELEANNELQAAYLYGYLKLGGVKPVSGDEALADDEARANEEQLQVLLAAIAAI